MFVSNGLCSKLEMVANIDVKIKILISKVRCSLERLMLGDSAFKFNSRINKQIFL